MRNHLIQRRSNSHFDFPTTDGPRDTISGSGAWDVMWGVSNHIGVPEVVTNNEIEIDDFRTAIQIGCE
jgi:hypothetical protein